MGGSGIANVSNKPHGTILLKTLHLHNFDRIKNQINIYDVMKNTSFRIVIMVAQ